MISRVRRAQHLPRPPRAESPAPTARCVFRAASVPPLRNLLLIARFAQQGAEQAGSSPHAAYQNGPAATPAVALPLLLFQNLRPSSCSIPPCPPLSKQQLTIAVLAAEAISCQENATGSTHPTPPDPPSHTDTVPDPAGRLHTNHQHSCKARGLLPVTRPSPL